MKFNHLWLIIWKNDMVQNLFKVFWYVTILWLLNINHNDNHTDIK